MKYNNYLKSSHWKRTKDSFFSEKKYLCSVCGVRSGLCLHHKHYKNIGFEVAKDLTYLCRKCHSRLHSKEFELFSYGERWRLLFSLKENKKLRRKHKKEQSRKYKPIFQEIEKYHEDFNRLVRSF